MSKSYGNTIDIFGDEKETRKRVMSIVTDSKPVEAPKDPASSTVFRLFSSSARKKKWPRCAGDSRKAAPVTATSRNNYSRRLWEHFQPMRKRREELLADKLYVDEASRPRRPPRQRSS